MHEYILSFACHQHRYWKISNCFEQLSHRLGKNIYWHICTKNIFKTYRNTVKWNEIRCNCPYGFMHPRNPLLREQANLITMEAGHASAINKCVLNRLPCHTKSSNWLSPSKVNDDPTSTSKVSSIWDYLVVSDSMTFHTAPAIAR